jgi:ParB/RepB/Spo0J family partition protein
MNEKIELIPIEKIRESKTNPRRTFNPADEKELIESIKSSGIVTPVMLRELHDQPEIPYEVVDGARRLRAANSLKMWTIPAIVRLYTEEEANEVQLISFAQRVDIDPLDEAAAYEQLRTKHFDIAQIAAKVGKERSYIAKRLQLTTLTGEAKKQFRDGRFSLAHAIEIARLEPKVQKEALDEIYYNAGTAKELREWIQEQLLQDLAAAPFEKQDATLVPKAGPCIACPKRSSNNPDLFGDISKRGDRCLDAKCFDAKVQAFRELSRAKKEKRTEEGAAPGKAPVTMAHRQELYKRRLEIFQNRIEQETRLRQYSQIVKRMKWPLDRKDFELVLLEIREKSRYDYDRIADLIGIKPGEFLGGVDSMLKDIRKLTDQQLAQFAIGALLHQELIDDPLMGIEDDLRLNLLTERHGVDRRKIRVEVAKEMEAKKPKPPKAEKLAKKSVKKSVKKAKEKKPAKKK